MSKEYNWETNGVVFNMNPSSDVGLAVCVALQTDYAGWKGTRQLLNKMIR